MQTVMEKKANEGIKLVRDLVKRGCSMWRIHKHCRVSYNAVMDWNWGHYCDEKHVLALRELRFRFCTEKGQDPFAPLEEG